MKVSSIVLSMVFCLFVATAAYAKNFDELKDLSLDVLLNMDITARKVPEKIQYVPIAVSAFSADELEYRDFPDISHLDTLTPNLVFDTAPPISGNSSGSSIFLRGVGQLDFTINVDPGVGLYLDGVYLARSIGSVFNFVDLERVEILRGPQGTLFGRNTIGGAIQLISSSPSNAFNGRIKTTLGDDNRRDILASVDLPLTNTLLSQFSFLSRQQDGYVRDGQGLDLGNDDVVSSKAQLLWRMNDRLSIRLIGDYTKDDEHGAPNVPVDILAFDGNFGFALGGDAPSSIDGVGTRFNFFAEGCPFTEESVTRDLNCFGPQWLTGSRRATKSNFPLTKSENKVRGLSLTTMYSAGWGSLKSITSYRDLLSEFARDSDHTPYPVFAAANIQDQHQFSQELQLSHSWDAGQWVLGLYYFHEKAFEYTQVFFPAVDAPLLLQGVFYNDIENESSALYGEIDFNLTKHWALGLGARLSYEKRFYRTDQGFIAINNNRDGSAVYAGIDSNNFDITPERFATFDIYDRSTATNGDPDNGGFLLTTVQDPGQVKVFREPSWRATLSYRPHDSMMFYGVIADSFKSGGFNPRNLTPTLDQRAVPFSPEFVRMLELGYKYYNPMMRANVALFVNDYDDIQISVSNPEISNGARLTQNAAEARIVGIESEFSIIPHPSWLFNAGFGWLDAQYRALNPDVIDTVTLDSRFPRVPQLTMNLGALYQSQGLHIGQLSAGLDAYYRASNEGSVPNDAEAFQPSYTLLNFNTSFETSRRQWRFGAGVNNITNEIYTNSINVNPFLGYAEANYARGRQYYFNIEYRFGDFK